jgi:putative addiction module component (TIGR02574 family)
MKPAVASDFDFSAMSPLDRLLLARQLIDSVLFEVMPLSKAELDEIDRRVKEIDSGAVKCYPWEEVIERLRKSLK